VVTEIFLFDFLNIYLLCFASWLFAG